MLAPLGVVVQKPADVGGLAEVVEDQPDFAGNARKKALAAAEATGLWVLADDSGLEVRTLGGAPGVLSARYSDPGATDARNNEKLLAQLAEKPGDRRARFVCVLCLAGPQGVVTEIVGETHGEILHSARGTDGFGYDPLFRFTEPGFSATGKAFAELSRSEKSEVSHRGRALRSLAETLPSLIPDS